MFFRESDPMRNDPAIMALDHCVQCVEFIVSAVLEAMPERAR